MASLLSQTLINENDSFYMLKNGAYFQGSMNISASGQSGGPTMNFNVNNDTATIQMTDGANDTNLSLKSTYEVDTYIGNKIVVATTKDNTIFFGNIFIEEVISKNIFDIVPNHSDSYLTKCGLLQYDPTTTPGGVVTSIKFGNSGIIQTTDKVQIGSTSVASLTVGPPAGDNVVVGPDRFAFQLGSATTGGLFQQGSAISIGAGSDSLNTGTGIIVTPSVLGLRKPIDAKDGISLTAQGAIVSASSADNTGGYVQVANGNYSMNLVAQGDGHAPSGAGGLIQSYNNGNSTVAVTKLVTGPGSYVTGDTAGNAILTATGTTTVTSPNITLSGSGTTTLTNTGATNITGADITLTGTASISINAPQVLINGGLNTNPVFYYQLGGTSDVGVNGNSTLGSGSFVPWLTTLYQSPGFGNRFLSGGALTNVGWTCPTNGVYLINISMLTYLQNATGGASLDIVRLPGGSSPVVKVGSCISNPGFQASSGGVGPTYYEMYQRSKGSFSASSYVQLSAGDILYVNGGQYQTAGLLYVDPQSTWSIQYVSPQ